MTSQCGALSFREQRADALSDERILGVTLETGQPRTWTRAEAWPCQLSGSSRTKRATAGGKKLLSTLRWPSVWARNTWGP